MRFVGGKDGKVFAITKHSVVLVGKFEWGAATQSYAELLKELLWRVTNSQIKAGKYHRLLMRRALDGRMSGFKWAKGAAWTVTDADVREAVAELDNFEADTARLRNAPVVPPPPPAIGGALPLDPQLSGYGRNDNAPDRRRR